MLKKVITIKHNDKDLHIVHASEEIPYVLATYAEDKQSKIFKLDLAELDLDEKQMATLLKNNS